MAESILALAHLYETFVETNSSKAAWLPAFREQARADFEARGLPDRKDEEWSYTPLKSLRGHRFSLPEVKEHSWFSAFYKQLNPEHLHIVFVDGVLVHMPTHPCLMRLDEALDSHAALVQTRLAELNKAYKHSFIDINSMFLGQGLWIQVLEQHKLAPLHILHVSTSGNKAKFPHIMIDIGPKAKARIYESYLDFSQEPAPAPTFTNSVVNICLGAQAELCYAKIQQDAQTAFHFNQTRVLQAAHSKLHVFHQLSGAAIAREGLHVVLKGEGAQAYLAGVLQEAHTQYGELNLYVEHAASHTTSKQLYKGLCADRSRGVFSGKIMVQHGCKHISAHQLNNNLLLSAEAEMDSRPQLVIETDDVKCSHGSSIGRLREEEIFYLLSRGIPAKTAELILCQAFASKALDGLAHPEFAAELKILLATPLVLGAHE